MIGKPVFWHFADRLVMMCFTRPKCPEWLGRLRSLGWLSRRRVPVCGKCRLRVGTNGV